VSLDNDMKNKAYFLQCKIAGVPTGRVLLLQGLISREQAGRVKVIV
jgi:hypothetical protein